MPNTMFAAFNGTDMTDKDEARSEEAGMASYMQSEMTDG